MIGIVSYGGWIPFLRLKIEEIERVWVNIPVSRLTNKFKLTERAVLQPNEDSNTMAVAAGKRALRMTGAEWGDSIDAVFLGTCTNPYDTRASVTVLQEALGFRKNVISADIQFGGKSGTTGMQLCHALVGSGMAKYAMAVGSDTINRHTAPGYQHEFAASAGAVAVIIGNENVIAGIKGTSSYSSELSDFFRLEGERYIVDNNFNGQPYPEFEIGMMAHVKGAADDLLEKTGMKAGDFDYAVFQQPYGSIPYLLGERLGFTKEQIAPGVVADKIGDCGSASAMLGLANVLDNAKPNETIFMVSYGFGAGADAFILETTAEIASKRPAKTVSELLSNKKYVDYAIAIRNEYKYMQEMSPYYM